MILSLAKDQINFYDNTNHSNHLDVYARFTNLPTEYSKPAGIVQNAIFLKISDDINESHIAFSDENSVNIIFLSQIRVCRRFETKSTVKKLAVENKFGSFYALKSSSLSRFSLDKEEETQKLPGEYENIFVFDRDNIALLDIDQNVVMLRRFSKIEKTDISLKNCLVKERMNGELKQILAFNTSKMTLTIYNEKFDIVKFFSISLKSKNFEKVTSFCLGFQDSVIFIGSSDGKVISYASETGDELKQLSTHQAVKSIDNLIFDEEKENLIATSDQFILRWN